MQLENQKPVEETTKRPPSNATPYDIGKLKLDETTEVRINYRKPTPQERKETIDRIVRKSKERALERGIFTRPSRF